MSHRARTLRAALTSAAISLLAGTAARAQDSVAITPGAGDALPAYTNHQLRYVLDLAPITSSWGSTFLIGPVLKASASPTADSTTLLGASAAISPDRLLNITFPMTEYAMWNAAGSGINPAKNSTPGAIEATGFDRAFALGLTSISQDATDAAAATIGQNNTELSRLFITRTTAAASRSSATAHDTATLALAAIDASGSALLRLDGFNTRGLPRAARGDSIAQVSLSARNPATTNALGGSAAGATAADAASTTFPINQSATTTTLPAIIPDSITALPAALSATLDFANRYLIAGSPSAAPHLPASMSAHRGNPTLTTANPLGGAATIATLARSASADRTDALAIFAIDASGTVVAASPRASTIPSPISAPGFSTNTSGDAAFVQHNSQVPFRGPASLAGIGRLGATGVAVAAATATDPDDGDFIAVATFNAPATQWTIAAHHGKPILSGPGGSSIGTILAAEPASISPPAVDLLGNIYFIARYQPSAGETSTALFKAVRTGATYSLELLVAAGSQVTGANSMTMYTIDRLTLADADSIAAGAFSAAMLHQPQIPRHETADAADPFAFGAAVVNARITYTSGGTPEAYDALLYIGPGTRFVLPPCPGDLNGDRQVNSGDLNVLLAAFAQTAAGDIDGDQDTDSADLNLLLAAFGDAC